MVFEQLLNDIVLWVLFIVSFIASIYITGASIKARLFPNRVVTVMWLITGSILVFILFKGFVEYLLQNDEALLVVGFLVGLFLYLNPIGDKKTKSKKRVSK